MLGTVLITYATRYGSTQETAENLGEILRQQGLAVDVFSVNQVHSLAEYSAVVVGAPFYMMHWHSDALAFLTRYQPQLTEMPVAIFALGPLHDDVIERDQVRAHLDQELLRFPWLTPAAVEVFGGKFDPTKLTYPHNQISMFRDMPVGDVRDWAAIHAWANHLAAMFQPEMAE